MSGVLNRGVVCLFGRFMERAEEVLIQETMKPRLN